MGIDRLDPGSEAEIDALAALLVECVDDGASLNFLAPLAPATARAWWSAALAEPLARTWVARDERGRVVGCVRLLLAAQQNGSHRGEVSKLLVSVGSRRLGYAGALLSTLEAWAAEHGRHRLVLDTEAGSPAEALYEGHGWTKAGVIPDFASTTRGHLAPASFWTKGLGAAT